jgi:hypothetical protein
MGAARHYEKKLTLILSACALMKCETIVNKGNFKAKRVVNLIYEIRTGSAVSTIEAANTDLAQP